MIPNNITKQHILQAIEDIETNGLRYPLGKSVIYDLLYNGRPYPPKHVVVVANEFANGKLLGHKDLDTKEAQNFLKSLGDEFSIVMKNNDPVLKLIEDYKDDLLKNGLSDEVYKWELLATYGGRPDLNAIDFGAEIRSIDYKNLIYHNGIAVRNHIVIDNSELYRECFIKLFDENTELEQRILNFQAQISVIYRDMGETLSHHHDERSIATFLTVKFPNKYSFYKNSFYTKYCKLKSIPTAKKNQKYIHYLALVDEFINAYIRPDTELLELVNTSFPDGVFEDKNHKLLAQDILYKMLDKKAPSFTSTILELEAAMLESDTVLNRFSVNKSKSYFKDNGFDSRKKDSFVWIADAEKKIGNKQAHYEISIRSRGVMKNSFFVDIHFEDEDKFKFIELIGNGLPEELEWFDWQGGSKSIGTILGISPTEEDLVEKLLEQLLYMETSIGEIVRETMGKEFSASKSNEKIQDTSNNYPLNQILYGPPGTGKTYKLKKDFFDKFTVKETELSKDQFMQQILADLNWWQVITIVLLDKKAVKVRDIYEHPFIQVKERLSESKTVMPTIWGQLQAHTVFDCPQVNVAKRSEPMYFWKDEQSVWSVAEDLVKELYPEGYEVLAKLNNFSPIVGNEIENYEFVTFHQSYSYEDFIEGIKPNLDDDSSDISYRIEDGVFKRLCKKAENNPQQDYAIFIDEINRGNVSAIFGELITLIEESKRAGASEALELTLPYSKEKFSVPKNLYIIGTMNTADRSVEALDTALRRRFAFEVMMPEPSKITTDGALANGIIDGIDLAQVLTKINERIEVLLDVDHQIGHSYLINVSSRNGLANAFNNCIVPLLKEYFYHDDEKIALVLGAGFVRLKEQSNNVHALFPVMQGLEVHSIHSKQQFELKPISHNTIIASLQTLLNGG